MDIKPVWILAAGNERGGAASHVVTFARALVQDGRMPSFRFVLVGEGYLADRIRSLVPDDLMVLPSHPLKALTALRSVLQSKDRPRLLHAHGPRLNLMARLACRGTVPWTTTLHSNVELDFLSSRWKSALLPRVNLYALRSAAGAFIVNPDFSRFAPNKPTFLVPNSIEMTPLAHPKAEYEVALRRRLGIPLDAKVVGIAARFDPVKDIPTLIRAVHHLRRPDVHLAIAGEGGERPVIERLIHDLGIGSNVHLVGFINDVQSFYAGLTVHVLSSRSEGCPTSLLEAGLAQVPNIGSRIPGITRLLHDGLTGLCFTAGDTDDLAAQLGKVLDSGDMRNHLTSEFAQQVLPKFTPTAMVDAYQAGYVAMSP